MRNWLRNIAGAISMGLAWAVAWAPIGVLIGTVIDPNESMDEPWVLLATYPGFLCGAVFFTAVRIAERRHRLDELSRLRTSVWGAMSGLCVGLLPFVFGSQNESRYPAWLLPLVLNASLIALAVISAFVSLSVARWWRNRSKAGPLNHPAS